jgi:hypothetical protein
MSPPGRASESTAPIDAPTYRPRPLLGVTFWAMLALMVLCVLAGIAVAEFGPRLALPRPPARSAADAAPLIEPAPAAPAATSMPRPGAAPVLPRRISRASTRE